MTKKQRDDFEKALHNLDSNAYEDCCTSRTPPDAADVAQALRAIWSRLDDIEVMARRPRKHGGRP